MATQKKITSKAIGRMREILSGIILGKLEHDQASWHCGTAHCVAGWNTALFHPALYKKAQKAVEKEGEARRDSDWRGIRGNAWNICEYTCSQSPNSRTYRMSDSDLAVKDWGLNDLESDYMFAATARLAEQVGLIEFLADGHRVADNCPCCDSALRAYVSRYRGEYARRRWAEKYAVPRPNSEIVEDLLAADKKETLEPAPEPEKVLEQVLNTTTA